MEANEIKKARKKLGLSQGELAKKIGVSKNTVYNYENGKKIPESKITILRSILMSDNKEPTSVEAFKLMRLNLDLTQDQLAKRLGVDRRTIINYEHGETPIPMATLELMDKLQDAVINKNGNEFYPKEDGSFNIKAELIPFEAYASYLETYNDASVQNDFSLVTFNVDHIGRGNYKAFRIKGDSMNGGGIYDTPDKALVLGRELLQHHWKDGFGDTDYGWIILSQSNIFHKDIIDFNTETGDIICHSRNKSPEYSDFELNLNEVYQIFKVIKRTF